MSNFSQNDLDILLNECIRMIDGVSRVSTEWRALKFRYSDIINSLNQRKFQTRRLDAGVHGETYRLLNSFGNETKYVRKTISLQRPSRHETVNEIIAFFNELRVGNIQNIQTVGPRIYCFRIDIHNSFAEYVMDYLLPIDKYPENKYTFTKAFKWFTTSSPLQAMNRINRQVNPEHKVFKILIKKVLKFYKITGGFHGDLHLNNFAIIHKTSNIEEVVDVRFFDYGAHTPFHTNIKNMKFGHQIFSTIQKQFSNHPTKVQVGGIHGNLALRPGQPFTNNSKVIAALPSVRNGLHAQLRKSNEMKALINFGLRQNRNQIKTASFDGVHEFNYLKSNAAHKIIKNVRADQLVDGLYLYAITCAVPSDGEEPNENTIRWKFIPSTPDICEFGSKHFMLQSNNRNRMILIAGELKKKSTTITYNFFSGTYMKQTLTNSLRRAGSNFNTFSQKYFKEVVSYLLGPTLQYTDKPLFQVKPYDCIQKLSQKFPKRVRVRSFAKANQLRNNFKKRIGIILKNSLDRKIVNVKTNPTRSKSWSAVLLNGSQKIPVYKKTSNSKGYYIDSAGKEQPLLNNFTKTLENKMFKFLIK